MSAMVTEDKESSPGRFRICQRLGDSARTSSILAPGRQRASPFDLGTAKRRAVAVDGHNDVQKRNQPRIASQLVPSDPSCGRSEDPHRRELLKMLCEVGTRNIVQVGEVRGRDWLAGMAKSCTAVHSLPTQLLLTFSS